MAPLALALLLSATPSLTGGPRRAAEPEPSEVAREAARADFAVQRAAFRAESSEWVQTHLHRAESVLRSRDVSDWSPERQQRRAETIEALQAYWQDGDFPWNDGQKYGSPIFVDDDGTHCAVGHIFRTHGMTEMVQRIREENNLGYVVELAEMDGVLPAVRASGLEPEEAAFVQPAYGYCESFAERFCAGTGGRWPEPSIVQARVVQATESGYIARLEQALWGPTDGLEETFPLTNDFRQSFFELEPGDGVLVTFSEQSRIVSVLGKDDFGARVRLIDEPCGEGLDIIEREATPLLTGGYESCLDRVEQRGPEWLRGYCAQGFAEPQISCSQGDLLEYEAGEEGPPVAPAPGVEPPPSTSEPGSALSRADQGGCQSVPPAPLGLLLAMAFGLARARRRR